MAAFLTRFHLPDRELSDLLLAANDDSAEAAVKAYLARHQARVRYWTTGELGAA